MGKLFWRSTGSRLLLLLDELFCWFLLLEDEVGEVTLEADAGNWPLCRITRSTSSFFSAMEKATIMYLCFYMT